LVYIYPKIEDCNYTTYTFYNPRNKDPHWQKFSILNWATMELPRILETCKLWYIYKIIKNTWTNLIQNDVKYFTDPHIGRHIIVRSIRVANWVLRHKLFVEVTIINFLRNYVKLKKGKNNIFIIVQFKQNQNFVTL